MEVNDKNIKKIDSLIIYRELLPMIEEIYESFKYIGISHDDYVDLVFDEINSSKRTYVGIGTYDLFIGDKIKLNLSKKIESLLSQKESAFQLLNRYLSQIFLNSTDYIDTINCFNMFDSFLKQYNYEFDIDILIRLIDENKNFEKNILFIFNRYCKEIKNGKLDDVIDNDLIVLIIDTYCNYKGIEIENSLNEEIFTAEEIDASNSLAIYLNEIGQIPMLSFEEERELAKLVAQGSEEAKKKFIRSNLRLVVSVAKKYRDRGLSFLDLVQEGNLGLMMAVERYDASKGYRFSTYATFWIRQSITRGIASQVRTIRLPFKLTEKVDTYTKTVIRLTNELNRKPTTEEIANVMNLTPFRVEEIRRYLMAEPISLNMFISEDKEDELEMFIPSPLDSPEDVAIFDILHEEIRKLFINCKLNEREIKVLVLRYGLNDNDPLKFDEIGKMYGLTRQRVKQIEEKALLKIRMSKYIDSFVDYMQSSKNSREYLADYRDKHASKARKINSIYEYFKEYTKSEIDEVLEILSQEEKELIKLRYGDDLDNPEITSLNRENNKNFYSKLIPKIKRMLFNRRKKENSLLEDFDTDKEEYIKMLEYIRNNEVLKDLSSKESIILSLRLGGVNGKCFTTKEIANFLSMDINEVREIIKSVLLIYRDSIKESPKVRKLV